MLYRNILWLSYRPNFFRCKNILLGLFVSTLEETRKLLYSNYIPRSGVLLKIKMTKPRWLWFGITFLWSLTILTSTFDRFIIYLIFKQLPGIIKSETHHILLYSIHPVLELISGGVHVCYHGSNVANDGGEDEHSNQEVNGDKGVPEEARVTWCQTPGIQSCKMARTKIIYNEINFYPQRKIPDLRDLSNFATLFGVRLEETVAFCGLLQKKELGHFRPNHTAHINHKKCQCHCFTSSLKSTSTLQKARKRF